MRQADEIASVRAGAQGRNGAAGHSIAADRRRLYLPRSLSDQTKEVFDVSPY